jgi:hypothetical protein
MICSSVNRALRIVDLLQIDSTITWREFRGAGHGEHIKTAIFSQQSAAGHLRC